MNKPPFCHLNIYSHLYESDEDDDYNTNFTNNYYNLNRNENFNYYNLNNENNLNDKKKLDIYIDFDLNCEETLNTDDNNFIPILNPNELYAQVAVHNYDDFDGYSPTCQCGNCDCIPYDTVVYGYKLNLKHNKRNKRDKNNVVMVCNKCAIKHNLKKIIYEIVDMEGYNTVICGLCNETLILKYGKNDSGKSLCVNCSSPYKLGVPGLKNKYGNDTLYCDSNSNNNQNDEDKKN